MQISAVLNIFIVKTLLNYSFTNDLKRILFSKNVHSYRSSLFKERNKLLNPEKTAMIDNAVFDVKMVDINPDNKLYTTFTNFGLKYLVICKVYA